jgi:hypothetical protein
LLLAPGEELAGQDPARSGVLGPVLQEAGGVRDGLVQLLTGGLFGGFLLGADAGPAGVAAAGMVVVVVQG